MIIIKVPKALSVRKVVIKTNVITIGIIITGLLSIVLTLLTYYGSYSGNFIVVMDNEDYIRGITLSETRDFAKPGSRLFADSANQSPDMTYLELKISEVINTDGNYHDPDYRYLAYTFYIKNNGTEAFDVNMSLMITEVYRDTDRAIRLILIEDDSQETIYQKPDPEGTPPDQYHPSTPITIPFLSDSVICEDTIVTFQPNQIKKYSIIAYLEGQDPDCIDSLAGGRIKMTMRFEIVEEEE